MESAQYLAVFTHALAHGAAEVRCSSPEGAKMLSSAFHKARLDLACEDTIPPRTAITLFGLTIAPEGSTLHVQRSK